MGKKADVQVFRNNMAFLLPQVFEQLGGWQICICSIPND